MQKINLKTILLVLVASVLLTGCFDWMKKPVIVETEVPTLHPPLPPPVRSHNITTPKVITYRNVGDDVWIGWNYDKGLDFLVYLTDISRYLEQSNSVLCYYRKDVTPAEFICRDYSETNK